ncbi:seminal plasma protein PDC-109-like [Hippopotamus amphibius kiboko]|uniref:seminal plasma protein PDC-109-like n=1 Tax=Hippopotamus amphibius kiboko TaxID=575201 RepID=UPI002594135E|nr:seminal plasma protein PDC-109-like [Hippopotamus amphibius kiboko]
MAPRLGVFLIWAGTSIFLQLDPVNGDRETLRAEDANNAFLLSDNECVFPFIYGGIKYFDCILHGATFYWCALNADYIGRWKYCTRKDYAKCSFPFIYRGKIYENCTKTGSLLWWHWCSLTPDYDRDRAWKYC